jgi:hypothetical protein
MRDNPHMRHVRTGRDGALRARAHIVRNSYTVHGTAASGAGERARKLSEGRDLVIRISPVWRPLSRAPAVRRVPVPWSTGTAHVRGSASGGRRASMRRRGVSAVCGTVLRGGYDTHSRTHRIGRTVCHYVVFFRAR